MTAKKLPPAKNIRVDDALWQAAKETAGRRGETVSQVVRLGLVRYVKRNRK